MEFNAEIERTRIVKFIKNWFDENGKDCKAVIGLSGGKDSTIVAALCAEALGKDRVLGVMMPNSASFEPDLHDADKIAEELGIRAIVTPIRGILDTFSDSVNKVYPIDYISETNKAELNLPPRVRMTMLYYVAQSIGGRVVGTTNASENFVGYYTRWGDQCSDVEPIINYTVTELKQIGYLLPVSRKYIDKTPDDGLPGSCPDEEKFGFTYADLDNYIDYLYFDAEKQINFETQCKIVKMHHNSAFKRESVFLPFCDRYEEY